MTIQANQAAAKRAEEARQRFAEVARGLLRSQDSCLDFGVYRIMNRKRGQIERFIETRLPKVVDKSLDGQCRLGELKEEVYRRLAEFFSRYFDGGDFICAPMLGENQYAIPYNGVADVVMHWANRGQYYIKSTDRFQEFSVKLTRQEDGDGRGDVKKVRFHIEDASIEKDNNKPNGKFLVPCVDGLCKVGDAEYRLPFSYCGDENAPGLAGGKLTQKGIVEHALGRKPYVIDKFGFSDEEATILFDEISRYIAGNTADFFIHKDLGGFLRGELRHYVNSEVLRMDLESDDDGAVRERIGIGRSVSAAATRVIDFLSQLEGFQKSVWEKKKIITEAHYCVTVGRLPATAREALLADIAACDKQWQEWRELNCCGDEQVQAKATARRQYLDDNPTLVADTANFAPEFKEALLAAFDNLDEATDGVLFHCENWQALNLLQEKYRGLVQCVYIDPPYNTDTSAILYKNGFKNSAWLSLMENRLSHSKGLMAGGSVLVCAIDDTEFVTLSQLLDAVFPVHDRNTVVVNHHPGGAGLEGTNISATHEYAVFMTPQGVKSIHGEKKTNLEDRIAFSRGGSAENNTRAGRPNSFYAVLVDPVTCTVVGHEPPPKGNAYPTENTKEGYIRIYPKSSSGRELVWRRSYASCHAEIADGKIICTKNMALYLVTSAENKRLPVYSNWTDSKYNAGAHGTTLLKNIIGDDLFSYPKSIHTVMDAVNACCIRSEGPVVLDYFAGSGTTAHAVINLNRADGGRRKFILAEMGEYFGTVLLPRIKKVVFAPAWKDGKPNARASSTDAETAPRLIKYHRIESYDDALQNVKFEQTDSVLSGLEEYGNRYMLKSESAGSVTFAAPTVIHSPFNVRLALGDGSGGTVVADLPETWLYLSGMAEQTRRVFFDGDRKYVAQYGEMPGGKQVVTIWRDCTGWGVDEIKRDAEFVSETILNALGDGAKRQVLANGECCVRGAGNISAEFAAKMFSEL